MIVPPSWSNSSVRFPNGDDLAVTEPSEQTTSYSDYLHIDELLSLQERRSDPPEHDELLFIVIHQIYELWFKEVLHELDELIDHLRSGKPALSGHQLKRVLTILKTLVAQLDVLETMTPLEFVSFRSFLANSSGFQSAQFREIEFLLGLKNEAHLERFKTNEREYARSCETLRGAVAVGCVPGLCR